MKSLILAFTLFLGLSSSSSASDFEANDITNVNENVYFQTVEEDFFGTCHIRIYDNETGELVYEAFLPANTAEDCKKMLKATLEHFNGN